MKWHLHHPPLVLALTSANASPSHKHHTTSWRLQAIAGLGLGTRLVLPSYTSAASGSAPPVDTPRSQSEDHNSLLPSLGEAVKVSVERAGHGTSACYRCARVCKPCANVPIMLKSKILSANVRDPAAPAPAQRRPYSAEGMDVKWSPSGAL